MLERIWEGRAKHARGQLQNLLLQVREALGSLDCYYHDEGYDPCPCGYHQLANDYGLAKEKLSEMEGWDV